MIVSCVLHLYSPFLITIQAVLRIVDVLECRAIVDTGESIGAISVAQS